MSQIQTTPGLPTYFEPSLDLNQQQGTPLFFPDLITNPSPPSEHRLSNQFSRMSSADSWSDMNQSASECKKDRLYNLINDACGILPNKDKENGANEDASVSTPESSGSKNVKTGQPTSKQYVINNNNISTNNNVNNRSQLAAPIININIYFHVRRSHGYNSYVSSTPAKLGQEQQSVQDKSGTATQRGNLLLLAQPPSKSQSVTPQSEKFERAAGRAVLTKEGINNDLKFLHPTVFSLPVMAETRNTTDSVPETDVGKSLNEPLKNVGVSTFTRVQQYEMRDDGLNSDEESVDVRSDEQAENNVSMIDTSSIDFWKSLEFYRKLSSNNGQSR